MNDYNKPYGDSQGGQYGYQNNPYQAPYGYQSNPYDYYPNRNSKNGMATASLVLGILSMLCIGSGICGILAIILGAIAYGDQKRNGAPTGHAVAGIVLGIISTVLVIGLFAFMFLMISTYGI